MTIIPSLLEQLRQLDARLTVQDGNLRIQSPRGPLPPVLREQLVAHKQELIVALGGGGSAAGDADTGAAIVPVDRSGPVPLSFAQQRLWTLDQLGADGATYAIHMGLRLYGAVDIAAMGSALDTLVHRHDILRSRYVAIDGQPMQVVDASAGCPFDAIAIDAADLDARLAQHAAQPFDLAAGPLFSAVLFTLGAQEHVLSLRMHHIVADGWSAAFSCANSPTRITRMRPRRRRCCRCFPSSTATSPSGSAGRSMPRGWPPSSTTGAVILPVRRTGWICRPTANAARCRPMRATCARIRFPPRWGRR